MAEDGMVINFKLDQEPFQAKPSFKGGRWRDRLSAKKAALRYSKRTAKPDDDKNAPKKDSGNTAAAGEQVAFQREENARPAKRTRLDKHVPQNIRSEGAPRQVISSLFTYNPESKTTFDENEPQNSEPAKPSNAPLQNELDTFTTLGLSQPVAEHLLHKLQIKAPTAIQKSTVPQLIKDDVDAFIQAETGSGKTLAYLLPIVQRLMLLSSSSGGGNSRAADKLIHRDSGLFAIVLAPTRELSKQIAVVLESLLRCANWIVSGTVIGGEKKKSEKARLRKGLNILIATPGRLADHLNNTEVLDVSNVRWLVLDEGDRLMELGFEEDIQRILAKLRARFADNSSLSGLPRRRNTFLCSATMKTTVQKLGEISLKDAVHVLAEEKDNLTAEDEENRQFLAPAQLKQSFTVVPAKLRLVSLVALLKRSFIRRGSVMKTIIFISCADSVDFHFEVLSRSHDQKTEESTEIASESKEASTPAFRTSAPAKAFASKDNPAQVFKLHGSLPQAVRTSSLAAFSRCKSPAVLVCTDVASRGLDLPNVDFVIEYDPPFNKEDHLHRVGRTARAGKDGRAMMFLMPGSEEGYVEILRQSRSDGGRDLAHHDANELLKKGFTSTGLVGEKDWEGHATEWQLNVERWALNSPTHLEQARRAYQSHVRAYATHVAGERHIFDMSEMHLGHLAKAFALRDKPGSIRVPGLRPSKNSMNSDKADRRAQVKAANGTQKPGPSEYDTSENAIDAQAAARKMRAKMTAQLQGVSEFNLG